MAELEPVKYGWERLESRAGREDEKASAEEGLQSQVRALRAKLEASEAREQQQAEKLEKLEERMAWLEKLVSMEFIIRGVAHEMNNLLTGALGFTHLLGRTSIGAAPHEHKMLSTVTGELNRCAILTRHLLHYSRNLLQPLRHEPFDLCVLVREVVEAAGKSFQERHVEILCELEVEAAPMVGVGIQVREVLGHLLKNASEAIVSQRRPGWIRLRLESEEENYKLEISDSGGGIREPERVFEPFYTTREVAPGSGVGLVIVKNVIKDHGGRIQLLKGEEGAIFLLRFPRAPGALESRPTFEPTSARVR